MYGTQIRYQLEKNTCKKIHHMILRLQMGATVAAVSLPPTPFLFNWISFNLRKDGTELQRFYNHSLFWWLTDIATQAHVTWASLVNYSTSSFSNSTTTIASGSSRYVYLPLPGAWFENFGLDLTSIDSDIEIRMQFAASPIDGVNSGAGAVANLLEVAALISQEDPDVVSYNAHVDFLNKHVNSHVFLDTQECVRQSLSMTAATTYEIDLDQFQHRSAALFFIIQRDNASIALATQTTYQTLGLYNADDGKFDVVSAAGKSEWANGRDVPAGFMRAVNQLNHGSNYFQIVPANLIPFTNDIQKAKLGIQDGVMDFDGSKRRLRITTPATGFGTSTYNIYVYSFYYREVQQHGRNIHVRDIRA
jgi:hypothetical protein